MAPGRVARRVRRNRAGRGTAARVRRERRRSPVARGEAMLKRNRVWLSAQGTVRKPNPVSFFAIALAGFMGAGVVLWFGPLPGPIATRTIPTGAGFTVSVMQLPTEPQARTIAARGAGSGLAAFSRA